MANKIKLGRATKTRIEDIKTTLDDYELVYTTDTNELGVKKPDGEVNYIGAGGGGGGIPEAPMDDKLYGRKNANWSEIISGGGGSGVDLDALPYMNYAADIFYKGRHQSLFSDAWTNHNKRTTLFDGNISLELEDEGIAIYSGAGIDELYDLLENGGVRNREALKITINDTVYDATSIDSVTNTGVALNYFFYTILGFPAVVDEDGAQFLAVVDGADLGMPLGKVIVIFSDENVDYLKIERGFNHYYENGIIIPDGVEIVPFDSYSGYVVIQDDITDYFRNNNLPLVIPNSVTHIGERAFSYWQANNQQLVIPNSVTSIGQYAFEYWTTNNHPLVIPNSVTSIGSYAFSYWQAVPYIIMERETPPTLTSSDAFLGQNDAPIYVPHNSVNTYKNATNWSALSNRIFSINDKP